ncbi:hypothetical protein ABZY31_18485 [Streptomyces sp. NPDC006529]|uniref:hypothetical protein n=1 Tax=Streptomyces sp. NPDC006529 TaxID=3157177 RepID=UPI0033B1FE0F
MNRRKNAAVALALVLLLGGCMSDDGINDPLPRMSREKAEEWGRHWVESMVRTTQGETLPGTLEPHFSECTGKGSETAEDGRFTLQYNGRATVPRDKQQAAIRALRDELKTQGFEIVGYREDTSVDPAYLVDAQHPKDRQFVSAEDLDGNTFTYVVNTPCLLPPGVEQQRF